MAKAEARRERIAAGLTRKEARAMALEAEAQAVPEEQQSYDEEASL
jgi:hypothetical protein